jgi:hypothetical protein
MSYLTEINCQTVLTAIKEEKQKQKTLIESQSKSSLKRNLVFLFVIENLIDQVNRSKKVTNS